MSAIEPSYKLRVAWDVTSGLDQTGADITSRTIGRMECWLGKDGSSNLVNRSNAGGLVAMLNNQSGDYSPNNTSGPLFGNLSPKGQAVRLTVAGLAAQFVRANIENFSITDNASLSTGDIDFTGCGWYYFDDVSTSQSLFIKWTFGQREYELVYDSGLTRFAFGMSSNGTSTSVFRNSASFNPVPAGVWIFVVWWHDSVANTVNIQVNNGSIDSTSYSGGTVDRTSSVILGADAGQDGGGMDGRQVAVGFWKRVLTTAEKTFLYRDGDGVRYRDIGLTGDGSALKTSLEAWWDLQEESGSRADSHGSNTLTDNNTVTNAEGIHNYSLWKGFLQNIEPLPGLTVNRARLIAVGSLGQVNINKIRLLNVENEVTGTAIGRILDEANWPADDRTVGTGLTTMTNFFLENEIRTLTGLRRVERTETGYIGESKDGRIVFEDRRHRQTSPYNTSQVTFTDANGGTFVYSPPLRQLDSQQQLFHKFPVSVPTYTDVSLAILWTLAASGADSPAIQPGETISFYANYPNPSSPTNAWLAQAWTTPVENTDYEANSQAGGGGDDKSGQLTITVDKFSHSMKINITNDDAATVFLTKLQGRGTSKTKDDPISITVETAATYPRTFPDPPQYIPSIAEALDWANWHNNVFNTVQPLLQMTFLGNRSAAQFAHALNLTVSDRMTMVADNDTGLGINEDFYIESERHVMDAKMKTHWTTWGLSAAQSQDAWTLDFSALDAETRLAYT